MGKLVVDDLVGPTRRACIKEMNFAEACEDCKHRSKLCPIASPYHDGDENA